MKTYIQEGSRLEYNNATGSDIASGAVVLVGSLVGVAEDKIPDTEDGILMLRGVHKLDKTTSQSWSQGAKLYWDDTNKKFTTTASGNTLCGNVWKAAASADTTGEVRLQNGA
ncbi:MAG: DUF2190 family protein [Pseudomonadota bacterium]